MDIERTNHWLTLIANFGVIAGVVFLGFEIQQNNELLIQESRYSMLQNQKDWKMFLNGDPEIAKLIYSPQIEELSELDKFRRFDIISGILLTWQWEWEQSHSKLLGNSKLPVEAFRTLWKSQNIQSIWEEFKPTLLPGFAEFMESEVVH